MEACTVLGCARSPPLLSSLALLPFCPDPCSRRDLGRGVCTVSGLHEQANREHALVWQVMQRKPGQGNEGRAAHTAQQALASGGHASPGWQRASRLGTSRGKGSELGRTAWYVRVGGRWGQDAGHGGQQRTGDCWHLVLRATGEGFTNDATVQATESGQTLLGAMWLVGGGIGQCVFRG